MWPSSVPTWYLMIRRVTNIKTWFCEIFWRGDSFIYQEEPWIVRFEIQCSNTISKLTNGHRVENILYCKCNNENIFYCKYKSPFFFVSLVLFDARPGYNIFEGYLLFCITKKCFVDFRFLSMKFCNFQLCDPDTSSVLDSSPEKATCIFSSHLFAKKETLQVQNYIFRNTTAV